MNQQTEHYPDDEGLPCAMCMGQGAYQLAVPRDHKFYQKWFPCENPTCEAGKKQRKRSEQTRLKTTRLPRQYAGYTFETWETIPPMAQNSAALAYYASLHFVDAFEDDHMIDVRHVFQDANRKVPDSIRKPLKNSLVFTGVHGTGKTGLMASIVNALDELGKSIVFTRAMDVIDEVYSRYDVKRKEEDDGLTTSYDVMMYYRTVPVMVIDDMQFSQITPHKRDIMEQIIRARYGDQLPTLITVNTSQEEFMSMWGERIADVVMDMAHWFTFRHAIRDKHESF